MIEIRAVSGEPFACRAVGYELCTEQRVASPSSLGSSETVKQTRVAMDPMVYAPPAGYFYQEMLALDVPILIPLGRDVTPSGYFDNWGATTVHLLLVRFVTGRNAATEAAFVQTFPIPIKMYDTLPLYRQFNEPLTESCLSSDHQVRVDVVLPVSSVGPQDTITVAARIGANPLYNRRRKLLQLKQVTVQLKEILECFDGGLPARKEQKLVSSTREYGKTLTTEGTEATFEFVLPHDNDLLDLFSLNAKSFDGAEVNLSSASFNKNKNFSRLAEGVPFTHVQGFTLAGKLYALRYEIVLKVKVGHGKDIELAMPLTVSPFNRKSSGYLLQWIKSECQLARDTFGKDVVAAVAYLRSNDDLWKSLRRYCAPVTVYNNTRDDWASLGYNPEAFGKPVADDAFVSYID